MNAKKIPDQVVFDVATQKYDASLKPYATNVGAPAITSTDTVAWKNRSINKLNHKIQTRYQEIKAQYDQLMHNKDNRKHGLHLKQLANQVLQ